MPKDNLIFETHAHYDNRAFDEDRDALLSSMPERKIGWIMNACASPESLKTTKALAEKYSFVYGAAGLHPDALDEADEAAFNEIRNLCRHEKFKAVGEIGLDYYHMTIPKERQQEWLVRFLELADEEQLPVIVHSREAAADTAGVLKEAAALQNGGVMHCYSYSREFSKQFLEMGFHIGIGGVATFKNAKKLVETIEYVPLSSLLLETDCPYLAPEPFRGKRNSSLYIPYIAEKIALIKGLTAEEVIRATTENALKLFKIHKQYCN